MNKKVALHTLGCKLNFSESSTLGNQFLLNDFEIVDSKEKADVYLFNTCTVTESAEKECRQLIRRALRNNPDAYIIVTGCYAQLRPEEISKIEGVDAVLGSNEKFNLFSILDNFNKSNLACIYVGELDDVTKFGEAHSTDADARTRAYFKIQDGCDYKCSFCTIPFARGKSRSMDPKLAVEEFTKLVDEGYKEIILTGVNIGDYGKAFNTNLFTLLSEFVKIKGNFRIRISSIEPNLLTPEIIDLIATEKKLCNHLHIPLQTGNSEILKSMQRRYNLNEFENILLKAHEQITALGIGVDVIVGFPGETEDNFIDTHNFLRNLPISYLHVFTYSERPGTKAIDLAGKVEIAERKRRNKILRILSEKKKHQFYQRMIGKEVQILFEQENIDGKMRGFTSNYVRVTGNYEVSQKNKLAPFVILGLNDNGLCEGKFIDTKNSVELISS
jgi:threonylcarbamoyladenosine tRNA methylthiotransferase MtaB